MGSSMYADALPAWIGAFACLAYAGYLHKSSDHSNLESRLNILLVTTAIFLIVRGIWWLTSNSTINIILNVVASVFPLVLMIFIEGLVRRHLPLFIKLFATIATIILLWFCIFHEINEFPAYLLLSYDLFVIAFLAFIIITRDKSTLSLSENQLISLLGATFLICLPLVITDFKSTLNLSCPRMGSIGVLVFVYVLIRNSSSVKDLYVFLRELFVIVLQGLLVGGCFWLLSEGRSHVINIEYISVGISIALLLNILFQIIRLVKSSREYVFQRWIKKANVDNIESFIQSIRKYIPFKHAIIVSEEEIVEYDSSFLLKVINKEGGLFNLSELEDLEQTYNNEDVLFGIEQMKTILKENESTDLCVLSSHPIKLLLINNPRISSTSNDELVIIEKLARALSRGN